MLFRSDVVYSVVSGPVAVTGNLVSVTGVGTAIIKASQPGNDEFNPAQEITQTFTVSKLNQTVTFPVVAALTYGDAAASLTATADSGLPVSYSVVSGPGTLVGNRLTATAAGEIVVRASQPGDAVFGAADNVDQNIVVLPRQLVVKADSATRAFGVGNPAFSVSYQGWVAGRSEEHTSELQSH